MANKNIVLIVLLSVFVVLLGGFGFYKFFYSEDGVALSNLKCQEEYKKVLAISNFNNTQCAPVSIRSSEFNGTPPPPTKKNIFLILDSSGNCCNEIRPGLRF